MTALQHMTPCLKLINFMIVVCWLFSESSYFILSGFDCSAKFCANHVIKCSSAKASGIHQQQ